MPWIDMGNGVTAHICTRGRQRQRCAFCTTALQTKLCDYPVARGKTCDAKMCDRCATAIGIDTDFCPNHAGKTPPQGFLALEGSCS